MAFNTTQLYANPISKTIEWNPSSDSATKLSAQQMAGLSSSQLDIIRQNGNLNDTAAYNNLGLGNAPQIGGGLETPQSYQNSLAQGQADQTQIKSQIASLGNPYAPSPGSQNISGQNGYNNNTLNPGGANPLIPNASLPNGATTNSQGQTNPPIQYQNQALNNGVNYNTSNGGTTGTNASTDATTGTNYNSPIGSTTGSSNNPYLNQVQSLSQLSPTEVDAQTKLNQLQANTTQGQFNVSQQPIAQGFVSGQQAAMQNQANIAQLPLQNRLALAQSQRQAALDAAKIGLDYSVKQQELSKPVFGYPGQSGYQLNPATGQYEPLAASAQPGGTTSGTGINPATGLSPNATVNDILGYLGINGIDPTRYDMAGLLNAVQNGATAQDIIQGRAGAAAVKTAATTGAGYKFNPISGNFVQPDPTAANNAIKPPAALGGFASIDDVKKFQQLHGLTVDGIVGPKTRAAMVTAGMTPTPLTTNKTSGTSGSTNNVSSTPNTLPTPSTYAQKSFNTDFTSGSLADRINAQNTAVGHLTAAYDLAQQMANWQLQPGNAGKNFFATALGKTAVENYKLAHSMSSSELAAAYGQGTGSERDAISAIGNSNGSPEQLRGFVQTSASLLSSKILSNIQQYKTAYGQNSPLNLNWFISPQNVQSLAKVGVIIKQSGNDVGAYQVQKDGTAKKI